MLVSIIVPIYNVAPYLEECINSIISQSYKNLEILLIDDGSTDGSQIICDKFAKLDSRIKVFHKSNGGLVSARKVGAHNCRGDYILNIDGDDFVSSNLIQDLVNLAAEYSCDAIAYGYKVFRDGNVSKQVMNSIEGGLYFEGSLSKIKKSFLFDLSKNKINDGGLIHSVWTKFVKRENYVLTQECVPDYISKGEDACFTLKLVDNISSIFIANLSDYYYVQRETSMMRSFDDKEVSKLNFLCTSMCQISPEHNRQIDYYYITRIYAIFKKAAKTLSLQNYRIFVNSAIFKSFSISVNEYFNFAQRIMLYLILNKKTLLSYIGYRLMV